jgi:hypothetical protein
VLAQEFRKRVCDGSRLQRKIDVADSRNAFLCKIRKLVFNLNLTANRNLRKHFLKVTITLDGDRFLQALRQWQIVVSSTAKPCVFLSDLKPLFRGKLNGAGNGSGARRRAMTSGASQHCVLHILNLSLPKLRFPEFPEVFGNCESTYKFGFGLQLFY